MSGKRREWKTPSGNRRSGKRRSGNVRSPREAWEPWEVNTLCIPDLIP